MRNFYLEYKDNEFLQPLVAEISWTKNVVIMKNLLPSPEEIKNRLETLDEENLSES